MYELRCILGDLVVIASRFKQDLIGFIHFKFISAFLD